MQIGASLYQSIFISVLAYGHELWVVTGTMILWIQAAEMSLEVGSGARKSAGSFHVVAS